MMKHDEKAVEHTRRMRLGRIHMDAALDAARRRIRRAEYGGRRGADVDALVQWHHERCAWELFIGGG